jgi:hypothetical protein
MMHDAYQQRITDAQDTAVHLDLAAVRLQNLTI